MSDFTQITPEFINNMNKKLENEKNFKLTQNAIMNVEVLQMTMKKQFPKITSDFSTDLHATYKLGSWSATEQKQSGRCWIFAGTNVLRYKAFKKLNTSKFQFSQSYISFWDKLERANYFFETIISKKNTSLDDRTLQFLFKDCVNDGGQFDMFKEIVKKYGLVPKEIFPETISSSKTRPLKANMKHMLLTGVKMLRTSKDVKKTKELLMQKVYRLLVLHYSTPPMKFTYTIRDKDKIIHSFIDYTPKKFMNEFISEKELDNYISIVNDPRNQFEQFMTVQHLGNIVGKRVEYLNLHNDEIFKLVQKSIVENDEPVFIGVDFGKNIDKENGIMIDNLFMIDELYDFNFNLSKKDRLQLGLSQMTHAMVCVGIDVNNEKKIQKLKIENSHGTKRGKEGFLTCGSKWFEEYNFQIVVQKKLLSKKLQKMVENKEKTLLILPPWDPMGALAK